MSAMIRENCSTSSMRAIPDLRCEDSTAASERDGPLPFGRRAVHTDPAIYHASPQSKLRVGAGGSRQAPVRRCKVEQINSDADALQNKPCGVSPAERGRRNASQPANW